MALNQLQIGLAISILSNAFQINIWILGHMHFNSKSESESKSKSIRTSAMHYSNKLNTTSGNKRGFKIFLCLLWSIGFESFSILFIDLGCNRHLLLVWF